MKWFSTPLCSMDLYVTRRSSITNLEDFAEFFDNGGQFDVIYIDLSKPFDSFARKIYYLFIR